ncbi:hypothetical protein AX17_005355 [Amanita inopinata Kibby_2008]|nr:hypothetical protein AX17_005355 [Amanita inopinata Kibby_2008]
MTSVPLSELSIYPATPEQIKESRRRTSKEWGKGMSEEEYVRRDAMADDDDHARDGRLVTWVLAPRNESNSLDFLCSCETFKRDGLIHRTKDNAVQVVECYGVASVFTPESKRGRGYARHLMKLLHWVLAPMSSLPPTFPHEWGTPPQRVESCGNAAFSALWSDVGKDLYLSCGPTGGSDGWIVRDPISTVWEVAGLRAMFVGHNTGKPWVWLDEAAVNNLWEDDAKVLKEDILKAGIDQGTRQVDAYFTFLPNRGVAAFQHRRLEHFWRQMRPVPEYWGVIRTQYTTEKTLNPETVYATWTIELRPPNPRALILTRMRVQTAADLKDLLYQIVLFCEKHGLERIEVWDLQHRLQSAGLQLGGKIIEREGYLPSFKWYGKEAHTQVKWLFNEKVLIKCDEHAFRWILLKLQMEDDVVETSDCEELEELRAPALSSQTTKIQHENAYVRDDQHSPRKRIKLYHSSPMSNTPPPFSVLAADSLVNETPEKSLRSVSQSQKSSSLIETPVESESATDNHGTRRLYISTDSYSSPFKQGSEDPLLLTTPEQVVSPVSNQSSPARQSCSNRENLDPLFSSPSIRAQLGVMDFNDRATPEPSSPIHSAAASPLTPLVSPQQNTLIIPPSLGPVLHNAPDQHILQHRPAQSVINMTANDETVYAARYSLRRRQAVQIAPYSVDKFNYKQALRGNPEAIVRVVSPERRRHNALDNYEDEQTQAETQDAQEVATDMVHRRHHSRSQSRNRSPVGSPVEDEESISYPELLQDLPSTDEEEDEELRTLSKEARKVLRELRAKQTGEEKQHVKVPRTARSFPLITAAVRKRRSDPMGFAESSRQNASRTSLSTDGHGEVTASLHPLLVLDRVHHHDSPADRSTSAPSSPHESPGSLLDVALDDQLGHPDWSYSAVPDTTSASGDEGDGLHGLRDEESAVSNDENSSQSETEMLDRKRRKALSRMVPAFMVNRLLKGQELYNHQQHKRQQSATVVSSDEEGPLLPGQTRVRRASRIKDTREIRGDSESSDDPELSPSRRSYAPDISRDKSSSDVEILSRPSPALHRTRDQDRKQEVINLSDTDMGSIESLKTSSEEEIDDEEIQAYFNADDGDEVGEENLIDWMLTRTRTIGAGNRRLHKSRRLAKHVRESGRRKYTFDIITRGSRKHGKGRQTLLNFNSHGVSNRPLMDGFRPMPTAVGRSDRDLIRPRSHDVSAFEMMIQETEATKNGEGRRKTKNRRTHRKTNGLYVFPGQGNTRITSGRNEIVPVSVATERAGYRGVPASSSYDWADVFRLPEPRSDQNRRNLNQPRHVDATGNVNMHDGGQGHRPATVTDDENSTETDDEWISKFKRIGGNLDVPLLLSGISFNAETLIGKGWLHELVSILSLTLQPREPPSCTLRGYHFGPGMSMSGFLTSFKGVCEGILEFATGLPEVDHAEQLQEWNTIMCVVCQTVSWLRMLASDDEIKQLQRIVETQAKVIIDRIRELALVSDSLDIATLKLDWFIVELQVRTECKVSIHTSSVTFVDTFSNSLSLLVDHLMEVGPQTSLYAVLQDQTTGSSAVGRLSAELWVSLIHLLEAYSSMETSQRAAYPFWILVSASLQKRAHQSGLKESEFVWDTIFCLCALSQFSVHGMTTSQPRLPASWTLVVFALKKIRLTADPTQDQNLPLAALTKRDRYIGIVTFRCFYLCDKWHWKLGDASALFNELGEIFRSRKFANLRHEKLDYPHFMLHSDWSLLYQYKTTDTAFVLFLKLIVRAAKSVISAASNVELSPKVRKLLSLAIPVGSLPFTKVTPPSREDLPMLFNRLGAVAISIHLDPASYRTRISHARTYVSFTNADVTTRIAVIRGMMNLAILMRKVQLPLDAVSEWISEIALALSDELKTIPTSLLELKVDAADRNQQQQLIARDRVHLCIQMLLGSIRRILELYKQDRKYPDAALIISLKSLLVNSRLPLEPKTMQELQRLTMVLLNARSGALPAPKRPHHAADVNPESQDEYNASFEFDFNDPNLIAALGEDANESDTPNIKANEEKMYDAINESHLYWLCWRNLAKSISQNNDGPTALTAAREKLLDECAYCWVGCADILVRSGSKKPWSVILSPRDEVWKKITNEALRYRVDLSIATQLLRFHPMMYSTHPDMFFEIFLESLATDRVMIEHDYLSLLLSIDSLQHPLLRGLACVEKPVEGDYVISVSEYSALRLPILQVIFTNLNQIIENEEKSGTLDLALDSQKFVGYCIKGFSAMRRISSVLSSGSPAYQIHIKWCRQLFQILQGLHHVLSHSRLAYWISWGGSLEMIS